MLQKKRLDILLWVMLALLVISIVLLAAVPPVSRDALTHHLAVPKLYLKAGGIYEIPDIDFSYYPMNLDLLYLVALYFGNDILPKYVHFAFGLLTAVLIYRFLKERTGCQMWGALGAFLFLSIPVIVKLSITVYVDLGLVFFSTASLIYLMKWALESHRWRHLVFAAIFCGLCMGTKYNGLISFFLLSCSVPILYLRYRTASAEFAAQSGGGDAGPDKAMWAPSLRAAGAGVLFVSISLAVFSPWMIRNTIWAGNPLYPLYQSVFDSNKSSKSGHPEVHESGPDAAGKPDDAPLSHFVIRKRVFGETLLEAVSTPVRIFFQGRDDNPKYFDGRLNPYLIIFPLLSFVGFGQLSPRRKIENATLFGFAVLYLLYAFFKVDMRIRYVAPIIPPLVLLSVFGFENACSLVKARLTGRKRTVGLGFLSIALFFLAGLNVQYLIGQFGYVAPLDYLSGKIGRDAYIQKFRSEYGAIQFINRRLTFKDRVLAVYLGNRIYFSDRWMVCDDSFINSAILSASTAEELNVILKRQGYTHLLIHSEFFRRFILDQLKPGKQAMVRQFFRTQAPGVFSQDGYAVFELKRS